MIKVSHLEPRAELLARLDVTAIVSSLSVSLGGASRHEIHLFGYLAAMAHSQTGTAPSDWGYGFAASKSGIPFADAIDYVSDAMIGSGELLEAKHGLRLASSYSERFEVIAEGESFGERIRLVRDVCTVIVFRSLPRIGRSVRSEPQLARAADLGVVRVIDEAELSDMLMRLMLRVRDQLPEEFPPSGPAMLWLDEWERRSAS